MRGRRHLGHSGVSHPGFPCWFLQKSRGFFREEGSPRRRGLIPPSAELSWMLSAFPAHPPPALLSGPTLTFPTRSHRNARRGLQLHLVCLPGKRRTPPTQTRPQPTCLHGWVVFMTVEASGIWRARYSALQEEVKEEGGRRLMMEGCRS